MRRISDHAASSHKTQEYRIIDFQKPHSSSAFIKNTISSPQFTFFSIIPKTLLREFQKISFLWFVFMICINQSIAPSTFASKWYIVITFGVLLVGILAKNYTNYFAKRILDKTINSSIVHVWKRTSFIDTTSGKIKVGDIILIKNNEFVPADIVLLACSNQENLCCIDLKSVLGKNKIAIKRPLKQTQLQNALENSEIAQFFKIIENIKVISPCKDFANFKGKIKFKDHPKSQSLDFNNFIAAGTKIVGNEWILGIAVYTGMETKVWINTKKNRLFGLSKFEKIINKVHLINVFIICGLVLISSLLNVYSSNFILNKSMADIVGNYFLLFGNLIPVSLFLSIKVCKFIEIFRAKCLKRNISILHPNALEDLGKVEYVLIEKSILVENKDPLVNILIVRDQILLETNDLNNSQYENDFKPISSTFNKFLASEYTSYKDFHQRIMNSDISEHEWKFLEAMSLCNNSAIGKLMNIKTAEEIALINTLEKFSISCKEINKKLCSISSNDKVFDYQILDEYIFSSLSSNNKILVRCLATNKFFLFVKGNYETIHPLISDENDIILIEEIIKSDLEYLVKPVLFVYKELTDEEVAKLMNDLKIAKLSHIDVDKKIISAYKNIEKDLIYLGLAGLEYVIYEKNIKTIKALNSAGLKTWIVTGDDEESTLIASHTSGIITENCEVINSSKFDNPYAFLKTMKRLFYQEIRKENPYKIDNLNEHDRTNQAWSQRNSRISRVVDISESRGSPDRINSILKKLTEKNENNQSFKFHHDHSIIETSLIPSINKKEQYNFSLSIDPQTLDFALSSPSHREVFSRILFLAKSVCFYSLHPDQKIKVAKFLKNNFSFKPTVLAIGDTGIGMLDEASIGVSIQNSKKQLNFAPEIKISKFSDLIELILVRGHYSYIRFSKVLSYTIYKETMVCTLLFLHQYSCNFSGTSIIDLDLLILFEFVISFVPIVIIGLFEKDASEDNIIASKTLYSTGFFNLEFSNKRIVYYHVIGCIQGVVIFVLLEYGYSQIENSLGFTENHETKGVLGFILISLSVLTKVLLRISKLYLPNILSPFISVGLMIFTIELMYQKYITSYSLSREIILSQVSLWIILFILPLISTLLYFIFNSIFNNFSLPAIYSRLETMKNNLDKLYVDTDDWEKETTSNSLEYNKVTLEFESRSKEIQYQQALNDSIKAPVRLLMGLMCLGMVVYFIFLYSGVIPSIN